MRKIRIRILDEAQAFLDSLPPEVGRKFDRIFRRVRNGDRDVRIFKKLDDHDFYEFRVFQFPNEYRIFAFWDKDEDSLIVATHGIVKKYQRLKKHDFNRMELVRKQYYNDK